MSLPSDFEDYYDKLKNYFEYKKKYDAKVQKQKRIIKKGTKSKKELRDAYRNIKVKCFGCNRAVGMKFEERDRQYFASCGSSTEPCSFSIILQKGFFTQVDRQIDVVNEEKQNIEDNVILLKLNLLFGFTDEMEMKNTLDTLMKEYDLDKEALQFYQKFLQNEQFIEEREQNVKDGLKDFNNIIYNHKQLLNEYMTTREPSILSSIIQEYVDVILPLVTNIRENKYLHISMEKDEELSSNERYVTRLVKLENPIYTSEAPVFEENEPKVISFEIPKKKR